MGIWDSLGEFQDIHRPFVKSQFNIKDSKTWYKL